MKQFRGVSNVFIAEVETDNGTDYITGTPQRLCYAATISKEVESDSATLYLDNKAMYVVNAEGSDTITIEGSALELDVLALITGKIYNSNLGMFVDGVRENKQFALGYQEDLIGDGNTGKTRFSWRLKGSFAIPTEESSTADDGTDSTGQSVEFTGVMTETKFANANNDSCKGIVVTNEFADTSDWFEEVKTPDTVQRKVSA